MRKLMLKSLAATGLVTLATMASACVIISTRMTMTARPVRASMARAPMTR
ncbi:hypothetical protein FF098_009675 [Parvularcula flava]|uniref:Lipoprotein n=1 Tax=Aquisalinus luteolus TaxID=1566827 RepID=A0ABX0HKU4_9PROT|nr:hypothetical protein [Aquisalinus luteolus]NHK28171.1 hypothetical protein [Aquisalinus luteolus]